MKASFEHAPDFSLPSIEGEFRLRDYNGRNRIALLFAAHEETGRAALGQVERGREEWQERDLLLVLVVGADSELLALGREPENVRILKDEDGEVGRTFEVEEGRGGFFLLGKSGFPVALCAEEMPEDGELFALIDAMPMRKQEMWAQRGES